MYTRNTNYSTPLKVRTKLTCPPRFETTLPDRTVFHHGRRGELKIKVDGIPHPTVKWMVDNTLLRDNDRIHTYTSHNGYHRLVIDDVGDGDVGLYTVFAFNAIDETIADTYVNVDVGPPIVSTLFSSLELKLDEKMCLVVSVKDYGDDYHVKWFRNKLPVSKDIDGIMTTKKPHLCSLKINSVKLKDSGVYKCVVTSGKETSVKFNVVVSDPEVKVSPSKHNKGINQNFLPNFHSSFKDRNWNNSQTMRNLNQCIPFTVFFKESLHLGKKRSPSPKLNRSKSFSNILERSEETRTSDIEDNSRFFTESFRLSSNLLSSRSTSLEDLLGFSYDSASTHSTDDASVGRKEKYLKDRSTSSLVKLVRSPLEKAKDALRNKTTPPVLVRYKKTGYA